MADSSTKPEKNAKISKNKISFSTFEDECARKRNLSWEQNSLLEIRTEHIQ
jgi:hypothetical protein